MAGSDVRRSATFHPPRRGDGFLPVSVGCGDLLRHKALTVHFSVFIKQNAPVLN